MVIMYQHDRWTLCLRQPFTYALGPLYTAHPIEHILSHRDTDVIIPPTETASDAWKFWRSQDSGEFRVEGDGCSYFFTVTDGMFGLKPRSDSIQCLRVKDLRALINLPWLPGVIETPIGERIDVVTIPHPLDPPF